MELGLLDLPFIRTQFMWCNKQFLRWLNIWNMGSSILQHWLEEYVCWFICY